MSDKVMKSITMPKALADTWLDALRNGGYTQGRRYLEVHGMYCCLGVLQMAVDGKVERVTFNGTSHTLPSRDWLERHGITFRESDGQPSVCNPFLPLLGYSAASANDNGTSFNAIADAIEATLETT